MARMMKVQLDYALERLDDAFHTILGPCPTDDENAIHRARAELVRSGKVKVTPALIARAFVTFDADVAKDRRWHDSIESHIADALKCVLNKQRRPTVKAAKKKWQARKDKLKVKYQEAKDELILGDVDRALMLIEAFRKTKV